ncbi:Helix-turn-helix domain protein [Stratiformator vulcanicus]|uniref:Helix-turn-helix domain protein n=2 Tax=Stratiformator vulcanicus TaxID=2527980 RepID=A0A517QWE7_9PLAN|nr:Helix-turn-helix domain protein [Stratiformator vulcanicus]
MDDDEQSSEFLSVAETAQHFRVSEKTVRRWIDKGRLFATQPGGPGGRLLIPRSELDAIGSRPPVSGFANIEQPRSSSGPQPRWMTNRR